MKVHPICWGELLKYFQAQKWIKDIRTNIIVLTLKITSHPQIAVENKIRNNSEKVINQRRSFRNV